MAAISGSKVKVNGVELYYEVKGTGPNVIVCILGAMGTADSFTSQAEYFGTLGQYKIVTYDPRGFGRSRPPQREFAMDFHIKDAQDTKGLMDALGFKKYSVFGFSDGAMIGIYLAAMYPDAVKKLVTWEEILSLLKKMQSCIEKIKNYKENVLNS